MNQRLTRAKCSEHISVMECQAVQPPSTAVWQRINKLSVELAQNPANPLVNLHRATGSKV